MSQHTHTHTALPRLAGTLRKLVMTSLVGASLLLGACTTVEQPIYVNTSGTSARTITSAELVQLYQQHFQREVWTALDLVRDDLKRFAFKSHLNAGNSGSLHHDVEMMLKEWQEKLPGVAQYRIDLSKMISSGYANKVNILRSEQAVIMRGAANNTDGNFNIAAAIASYTLSSWANSTLQMGYTERELVAPRGVFSESHSPVPLSALQLDGKLVQDIANNLVASNFPRVYMGAAALMLTNTVLTEMVSYSAVLLDPKRSYEFRDAYLSRAWAVAAEMGPSSELEPRKPYVEKYLKQFYDEHVAGNLLIPVSLVQCSGDNCFMDTYVKSLLRYAALTVLWKYLSIKQQEIVAPRVNSIIKSKKSVAVKDKELKDFLTKQMEDYNFHLESLISNPFYVRFK